MISACNPPQVSYQEPGMWDPKTHPNLGCPGVLVLAIKDEISQVARSAWEQVRG